MKLKVTVNGTVYDIEVEVEEQTPQPLGVLMPGGSFAAPVAAAPAAPTTSTGHGIQAPLAGTVAKILVEDGQDIKAGETVIVLEAMKMETAITAPSDGKVAKITVKPGDTVQGGQVLIELE